MKTDRRPRPGIVPGRPVMRPWAADALQVVLNPGGPPAPGNPVQRGLDGLRDAFNDRPFADPAKVAEAAKALEALCQGGQADVRKVKYTPAEADRLYNGLRARLASVREQNVQVDHDAAQQLLWGLVVLREELTQQRAEAPELDKVVRLRIRDRERDRLLSVEERLEGPEGRYAHIYGLDRDKVVTAAEAFANALKPKK